MSKIQETCFMKRMMTLWIALLLLSCSSAEQHFNNNQSVQTTRTVSYNGVTVDIIIDKPSNDAADVLIVYRGTIMFDDLAFDASKTVQTVLRSPSLKSQILDIRRFLMMHIQSNCLMNSLNNVGINLHSIY